MDKEFIGSFLNVEGYSSFKKENRSSTLMIALRGARSLTERDLNTGHFVAERDLDLLEKVIIEKRYHASLFLGVTNYLIILDLMGCVFRKKTLSYHSKDGVEHALSNFSLLNAQQRKAIKALRNSLAHNFGLANESHIFTLSTHFADLIELPKREILAKQQKVEKDNYTKINEVKLCQLIEDIYQDIIAEFKNDNIALKRGMNMEKLKRNFTIK